ncbi:hypothetical protein [uncultured Corynebacterium sp.]|uniref:hypothetical protein n=1 Tax=uncultured Corynebacterium sp. TaxID=159447 RepID=UPI002592A390|nr:hypothetical protein [uncultured Corynebacterium sp.]
MHVPHRLASASRPLAAALVTALPLALAACGSVDPADNQPVTELRNQPEGFTPTDDGETLSFHEPAKIVTTNYSTGVPVYWEVTVHEPETMSLAQVKENIGRDPQSIGDAPPERVKQFFCFPVTFTPLGSALGRADAPVSVELPTLTPVDDYGTNANFVGIGDERYCGLDRGEEVPAYTGDMRIGHTYTTAVVSWEGQRDPGIVGTGVRLNTLPSPRNPAQPAQAVTWTEDS